MAPLTKQQANTWKGHIRDLLPLMGWAPWWLPTALGLLWGARGSPRCPLAATRAASILGWLRREGWGPTPFANAARDDWAACRAWAQAVQDANNHTTTRDKAAGAIQKIGTATA